MTRTRQSSLWASWPGLWARWLGWTVLYVLALCGALFVAWSAEPVVLWGLLLGLLVLAFLIGVRFRSAWWGFGPPLGIGLGLFVFVLYITWTPPPPTIGFEGWTWTFVGVMMLGIILVIPCSLAALAGVWWGKRRHDADPGPECVRSGSDASTEPMG